MGKASFVSLAITLFCSTLLAQNKADIVTIYPKSGQAIAAVDSTFVLGHVIPPKGFHPNDLHLYINGTAVSIENGGGWLAFLPLKPGDFTFYYTLYKPILPAGTARHDSELVAVDSLWIKVPEPSPTLNPDSLVILGDYMPPRGDLVLSRDDLLEVRFRGAPSNVAWFSITGLIDSIPMAEADPRQQPFWGESVFGKGAVPDSLLIRGLYTGYYEIKDADKIDTARIIYHLAKPPDTTGGKLHAAFVTPKPAPTPITRETGYRVSVNPPGFPFTVRLNDSVQILRYGPMRGYYAIAQPSGVEALVVGAEADWWHLRVAPNQCAWVNSVSCERLPFGILPPRSILTSIRMFGSDSAVDIQFPLAGRHPFRVFEDSPRKLRLQLFGVISNTDWIRYDATDPLVTLATWQQPDEGVYEFSVETSQDIWGYDTYYDGTTFYLSLIKPPKDVADLKGKRIVVDPGHSADPGSVGPTGYTEAQANLAIALELADILRHHGATVIMTRSDSADIPLNQRPVIAKLAGADLFVSVHNNALPDGVNPWLNNGTSAYYYHPHSIKLARAIHTEMVGASKLTDHGLYYGNLAVARPTQYPAVLVECAFMIIPEQEAMLKDKKFREDIAKAITRGIEQFLKEFNNGE